MADVSLKSASFGNVDPSSLAATFLLVGQPAVPTADGVLISPRVQGPGTWLQFRDIAQAGFDNDAFTNAMPKIDPRIDLDARLREKDRTEAEDAVRRWLKAGDFGQIAHKFLETVGPNQRHLLLREIVLPVFFEKYPGGRLACVTYNEQANGYLIHLNVLKKMQMLNSRDPNVIAKYAGKFSMSSYALNVPAEMIWLMLSFVSVLFFPEAFAFVASCEHRYFLVFITDCPIDMSQAEDRYPPIARLVPIAVSKYLSGDPVKRFAPCRCR